MNTGRMMIFLAQGLLGLSLFLSPLACNRQPEGTQQEQPPPTEEEKKPAEGAQPG
jgi:hypothetical protein